MENIIFVVAAIFIAWGFSTIQRDIRARNISTALVISLNSKEEDENGVPLRIASISKKTNISFAIVPNMELFEAGLSKTLKVSRVLFEDSENQARVVYFETKYVDLSQIDQIRNEYIRCGWK